MVTPGMRLRIPPMPSSPFIQPLSPSFAPFAATTTALLLRVDGDRMGFPELAPRPPGGACERRRRGDAAAQPADDDMGPRSPSQSGLPPETYRETGPGRAESCAPA